MWLVIVEMPDVFCMMHHVNRKCVNKKQKYLSLFQKTEVVAIINASMPSAIPFKTLHPNVHIQVNSSKRSMYKTLSKQYIIA